MSLTAIVPLKWESSRLQGKNFRPFNGKPLAWWIFEKLLDIRLVASVYCYSSDESMLDLLPQGVKYLHRPAKLDSDETQANELFELAVRSVDGDDVGLFQAPSPLLRKTTIEAAIERYFESAALDVLFSACPIRKYCWFNGKPLNYDPKNIVKTQDLDVVYYETSGFFMFNRKDYLLNGTRIYGNAVPFELDVVESIDIDYLNEFKMAELLASELDAHH